MNTQQGQMPATCVNDEKQWRDRAAQMRALARTMRNPNAAILMTDLAADKLVDDGKMPKGKRPPNSDLRTREHLTEVGRTPD
jgi:hypothetical protein